MEKGGGLIDPGWVFRPSYRRHSYQLLWQARSLTAIHSSLRRIVGLQPIAFSIVWLPRNRAGLPSTGLRIGLANGVQDRMNGSFTGHIPGVYSGLGRQLHLPCAIRWLVFRLLAYVLGMP